MLLDQIRENMRRCLAANWNPVLLLINPSLLPKLIDEVDGLDKINPFRLDVSRKMQLFGISVVVEPNVKDFFIVVIGAGLNKNFEG